ncbi:MAG: hypothetical protein ACRD0V_21965, partial [Acidimicrobiales bacterium]
MTTTMDVPLATVSTGVGVARSGRRLFALVVTAAILVAAGWAAMFLPDTPSDDVPLQAIRIGLVAVWGLVGGALALRRPHEPLGLLVLAGTLVGAAAVLASAALQAGPGGTAAELVRALAVGVLPAVALQVVAVLPDGRLARPSQRTVLVGFYVAALAAGLGLASARPDLPLWVVAIEVVLAAVIGASMSNARYVRTRGEARQRMQWFGLAVTLAVEIVLVAVALRIFLDWPHPLAEIATAATVLVPLSFVPCMFRRMLGHVDRLLGEAVSLTGLTGVV